MKKDFSKITLGDVARAAGVSKSAASFALQNRAGVSKATRARILRLARKLNYTPDARVSAMMSTISTAGSKDLVPIAWLNANSEEDAWSKYKFLSPYLQGAQECAQRLGYRIDEIWANGPEISMRRIAQVLYQTGIEGVIITHPCRRFRLNWDFLASISLEGTMLSPLINSVTADYYSNLLLALKVLRRFGYRRIGICLDEAVDRCAAHTCDAATQYFQSHLPKAEIIPALYYKWGSLANQKLGKAQAIAWMKRHRPDVVVGLSNQLLDWVKTAGFHVPGEMGVVHLATDDDVSDWAGVCSHRRQIGSAAVELLVSLMRSRRFGIPELPLNTLVRGEWHPGRTLLLPKPQ
jgi:LacI family transcriptional regulator